MAEEVDRNKVFETTRVKTSLRNDVSWIQGPKQGDKVQDSARTAQAVETKPAPVRENSYVLLTAKKFDDSANQENCEVVPPHKDAQPEGSTVETADDIKSQAVTEKPIQNGEAQPDTSVENTTAENKEENADTAVVLSNGEQIEVSADVHAEEHVQNGEAKEDPESVSPVELTEQQLVNTTSEIKGEHANTAADESSVEQNEVKVSADAHVEDAFAETPAAAGIGEDKDSAVVPAVLLGEPKIEDQPSAETEPAEATNVEDAGVESTAEPAEGSSEKCPPEEAAGEIVKAVYVAVEESSPDKSDVIDTASGGEAVLQDSVETVPDVVASPVSESPTHPAAEAATDGSCETGPSADTAEAAVEVKVESLPAPLAPANAAGDKAAPEDIVKEVPDLVADTESKSPTQPAAEAAAGTGEDKDSAVVPAVLLGEPKIEDQPSAETEPAKATNVEDAGVESIAGPAEGSSEKCPVEEAAGEIVKAVYVAVEESSPDKSDVIDTASGGEAVLQDSVETVPDVVASPVSESPTHPAAEAATDGSCETGPSADTAEAAVEVKVESLPAPLAPANAAGDKAAPEDIVKEVPDLAADTESKSPTQPAAEAAVESADSQVVSAASAEPVSQTRADEVVKLEVQPVQSAAVEQTAQPATENASDQVVELSILDALEPVTAPTDNPSYDAMELTDALDVDVKPPASDAAAEPAKDPEQSHTEEKQPIQQSDLTNISEISQKTEEEQRPTRTLSLPRTTKTACSFCDKTIDGNVRLIFSEPLMECHPDCLKCGVCAKALGDLLTPMFLRNQVIQCDGCFAIALKT